MAIQPIGQAAFDARYEPGATVALASDERRTWLMNHAAWGAIFAGLVAALLTQLLFGLLGLGISLASFQVAGDTAANPTVAGMTLAAALWWVASGLLAAFVGGVVAGRLCGSARHSTAAWHGFVAWCSATLLVVWLLGSTLGGALGGAFTAAAHGVAGVADATMSAGATAAKSSGPDGLQAQVRSLVNPNDPQTVQSAIVAYVQASANGDKPAADAARQQAVDSLARVANISPEEAQNRLNQLQQKYQQTAQQARQAAEAARKGAARAALFAFSALLLSGIASIVGGGLGAPRRSMTAVV